jgi:hypothetical protein
LIIKKAHEIPLGPLAAQIIEKPVLEPFLDPPSWHYLCKEYHIDLLSEKEGLHREI